MMVGEQGCLHQWRSGARGAAEDASRAFLCTERSSAKACWQDDEKGNNIRISHLPQITVLPPLAGHMGKIIISAEKLGNRPATGTRSWTRGVEGTS